MKKIIFVCFALFVQVIHSENSSLEAIKKITFDRMEITATHFFDFKVESETIDNERKQTISVKTDGVDQSILLISVSPELIIKDIRSTTSVSGSIERGTFNSHGFRRPDMKIGRRYYVCYATYKYRLHDDDKLFMIYVAAQRIGDFDVKKGDRFDTEAIKKIKAALPSYWDDGEHVLLGKIKICDVRARWHVSAKEVDLKKSKKEQKALKKVD